MKRYKGERLFPIKLWKRAALISSILCFLLEEIKCFKEILKLSLYFYYGLTIYHMQKVHDGIFSR